jgi:hypothetical protein
MRDKQGIFKAPQTHQLDTHTEFLKNTDGRYLKEKTNSARTKPFARENPIYTAAHLHLLKSLKLTYLVHKGMLSA